MWIRNSWAVWSCVVGVSSRYIFVYHWNELENREFLFICFEITRCKTCLTTILSSIDFYSKEAYKYIEYNHLRSCAFRYLIMFHVVALFNQFLGTSNSIVTSLLFTFNIHNWKWIHCILFICISPRYPLSSISHSNYDNYSSFIYKHELWGRQIVSDVIDGHWYTYRKYRLIDRFAVSHNST